MNDLAARIVQSRNIIEKTPHVDFSYLTALLDHIETIKRERDEARAEIVRLQSGLLTGMKYANPLEQAYMERAGFDRGVKEAREAMRYSASGMTVEQHAAILALLEKPEQERSNATD